MHHALLSSGCHVVAAGPPSEKRCQLLVLGEWEEHPSATVKPILSTLENGLLLKTS